METIKPFKTYGELVDLLKERGMVIEDGERALRKLAQIGYYRFTGYSYPFREFKKDNTTNITSNMRSSDCRCENFFEGTTFNTVFNLYLMDKKLRLAIFDAIERIEIYVRSIIAHEMGYHSPLAYEDDSFINPDFINDKSGKKSLWTIWKEKHAAQIASSKLDCIVWHINSGKKIPIWVAVECWDFGMLSKYFSILNGKYKNKITKRISNEIKSNHLNAWLNMLNNLRNKCAHHARIWNYNTNNPLPTPNSPYFNNIPWGDDNRGKSRIYGIIIIIWYLVKLIGPRSTWIQTISKIIEELPHHPSCSKRMMGFPSSDKPVLQQLDFLQ